MKTSLMHVLILAATLLAAAELAALPTVSRALSAAPTAVTAGADIVRSVIGSGGGHTASASYSMDTTNGQPLTGVGVAPGARLSAGFWQADYRTFMPLVLR